MTPSSNSVSAAERWLVFLLRFAGAIVLLAFAASVLPRDWMAASHRWLGLGEFPESPAMEYLARSISVLYGLHGVLLLLVARDVVRFRPIVWYFGVFNVVLGGALLAIDLDAGLPWWWTWAEGPSILSMGVLLLVLVRSVPDVS